MAKEILFQHFFPTPWEAALNWWWYFAMLDPWVTSSRLEHFFRTVSSWCSYFFMRQLSYILLRYDLIILYSSWYALPFLVHHLGAVDVHRWRLLWPNFYIYIFSPRVDVQYLERGRAIWVYIVHGNGINCMYREFLWTEIFHPSDPCEQSELSV